MGGTRRHYVDRKISTTCSFSFAEAGKRERGRGREGHYLNGGQLLQTLGDG